MLALPQIARITISFQHADTLNLVFPLRIKKISLLRTKKKKKNQFKTCLQQLLSWAKPSRRGRRDAGLGHFAAASGTGSILSAPQALERSQTIPPSILKTRGKEQPPESKEPVPAFQSLPQAMPREDGRSCLHRSRWCGQRHHL